MTAVPRSWPVLMYLPLLLWLATRGSRSDCTAIAAMFDVMFGGAKAKRDSVIGNMETQINSVSNLLEVFFFCFFEGANLASSSTWDFQALCQSHM